MRLLDLSEVLNSRVLIGDGAMGTLLGEHGVGFKHPYDRANITRPDLVQSLHEQYIRAGADLIETNTFSANRVRLAGGKVEDKVREINAEGARLARKAVEKEAKRGEKPLVQGAIGPLGKSLAPIGQIQAGEAREMFREQAEALLEGGADVLLLQTFPDFDELKLAYETVSEFGVPVLAYKTFVEDGETLAEGLPAKIAVQISGWGAAVVGSNCTVGPQRMVGIVEQMSAEVGPVAALPNPGLPQLIDGTIHYRRDVRHFASYGVKLAEAGARLVGGCCGTTPEHTAALAEALKDFQVDRNGAKKSVAPRERVDGAETSTEPVTGFAGRIKEGFATTVEVDLPRGNDISEVIEASRKLKERGVHAIDISDGARARLRMHPIAVAKMIQDEVGIEVVAHISCRDRNIIGLQADLLSAAALDVRNILAVTGDPAQIGDYPEATSVFDTDSVGLVHILSKMNRGEDLAGNSIGKAPGFLIGASFNPTAEELDGEIEKLRRKVEAGAHAFWTQPVFEIEDLENSLEEIEKLGLEVDIILGLMPLRSARQAEFLHHEVPGINIPKRVRTRLAELTKEDAPKYGVEVAREL
ncbi:MAG: bifunctional homocysteine S-methyltransferase/methylenetetrahydrofolate reductase, partial [Rubrobacteraceae bacterium]